MSLALAGTLAVTALAAPDRAAPAVSCTSGKAGLAAKLRRDITAALSDRGGTVAIGLRDPRTNTTCTLRRHVRFDSASIVKVTLLATLLWDAERKDRYLTDWEESLIASMITKSSNSATRTLWGRVGVNKVRSFLHEAGMTQTVPGPKGYWGLTRTTVRDQQRLLALFTKENPLLGADARAAILRLMNQVTGAQRWGTPAGAPATVTVHVKNGWLPRATHGWRVHSTGVFRRHGRTYTITVLTQDNETKTYGVNTIQSVARAIHRNLNPASRTAVVHTPPPTPAEVIPPLPPGRRGA
ncbi:serine hydrolase [Streptomyces sp. NPDC051954]|uniref:serine hydrolase n=1 Tax=Streptomyces sp. NPDC051954 TaxID=3155524 RepID=UPI003442B3AE